MSSSAGTDFILQENGSKIELESSVGDSFLILERGVPGERDDVGGSGRGKSKQIGHQLSDRPTVHAVARTAARLKVRFSSVVTSQLAIRIKPVSIGIMNLDYTGKGTTLSQLEIKERAVTKGILNRTAKAECIGIVGFPPDMMFPIFDNYEKIKKLNKIQTFYSMLETLDFIYPEPEEIRYERFFFFDEIIHDEKLRAFTHSSSFIGNVRYNSDDQSMRILLNGKAYHFCNVPERIYDAFEGANSKGAYFARNIKGQFDC